MCLGNPEEAVTISHANAFSCHFSEQPLLIEGDIVDDAATRVQMEAEANGIASTFDAISGNKKWPNGVVPYVYGSVGK